MIDTIRIKSPYISEELANEIYNNSFRKFCVSPLDDIMYEFTSSELKGSFDSKIMIKLKRQEWKKEFYKSDMKWITSQVDCNPYLEIELSIHKFILGHNVYGGSNELIPMMKYFEKFLNDNLDNKIPDILDWEILRLDYAEVFKIDFIDEFIYMMENSNYPRRKVRKYSEETIYFSGTTTTLKMYNKNKEFLKNDKKRLKGTDMFDDLVFKSKGILRVEVEVNKKKFIYDNGRLWTIKEFNIDYMKNVYDKEIKKVMNNREENKMRCDFKEVKDYLYLNFTNALASTVLSTYSMLSVLGEKETKKNLSKATYYRHRSLLLENNISWENSNLRLNDSKVIEFLPYRDSRYIVADDLIIPFLKKAI